MVEEKEIIPSVGYIEEKADKVEEEIEQVSKKSLDFLRSKNFLSWLPYILLVILVWLGSFIRTRNLSLLKDVTTGNYIPVALDPYYFLRLAEILLANGSYPAVDTMRAVPLYSGFIHELLPRFLVFIYKIMNFFGEFSMGFVAVVSPVIFFALGIIAFFFLIKALTNTKIAIVSSAFLTVIPLYLYRTMAGFSDHEAPGMIFFFLALLSWVLVVKAKKNWPYLVAVVSGLMAALAYGAWFGLVKYILLIIPLSVLLAFSLGKLKKKLKISYLIWFIITVLFMTQLFGFKLNNFLAPVYVLAPLTFAIILFDFLVFDITNKFKNKLKGKIPHEIASIIMVAVLIILILIVTPIFDFGQIINKLIHPFGTERIGLTVAENKQPYFNNWTSQMGMTIFNINFGVIFFWLFFFGLLAIFYEATKHFRKKKLSLNLVFIIFISGLIFSRYSQNSLFNGENFISRLVYFGSILIFFGYIIYLYLYAYYKDKNLLESFEQINYLWLFMLSWLILMLISARGAIRLFFITAPFVCFAASFLVIKSFDFRKSKDDLLRTVGGVFMVVILIASICCFAAFTAATYQQAQYTSPSANQQWQNAMSWIRENTAEDSVFIHWWDYGYWVQYLGQRATVTDGGHPNPYWDHMLGRHFLCANNETEALEYMYSHEVDYALIDPTDIGKYPAYSSIGSNTDYDALSYIGTFNLREDQITETKNETRYLYAGNGVLDEDLIIGNKFFPGRDNKGQPYTGVGAIILPMTETAIKQPEIVIIHNNLQETVKIRYAYLNEELYDFGSGIESCAYILPRVSANKISNLGAALYIPERGMKTQWVRMYLLNETENFNLVHSEQDPAIKSLQNAGIETSEIMIYQGLRGPIKIWEVDYPSDFEVSEKLKEKYLKRQGSYDE